MSEGEEVQEDSVVRENREHLRWMMTVRKERRKMGWRGGRWDEEEEDGDEEEEDGDEEGMQRRSMTMTTMMIIFCRNMYQKLFDMFVASHKVYRVNFSYWTLYG